MPSFEIPKSPNLQWPSLSKRMFCSLISLPNKDTNHMQIITVVLSRRLHFRLSDDYNPLCHHMIQGTIRVYIKLSYIYVTRKEDIYHLLTMKKEDKSANKECINIHNYINKYFFRFHGYELQKDIILRHVFHTVQIVR